jgi:hypothetical protein
MRAAWSATFLTGTAASNMQFNKMRVLAILMATASLSACQSTGTASDALLAPQGAVQSRQIESRVFEVKSDKVLVQSIVATLQYFGFKITESSIATGMVSGSKSQASGGFSGYNADVRVTVTSTPIMDGQSSIRTTFQKILPSHDPRLFRTAPIQDDTLYQKFYNSLEQALFLSRNT